MVKDLASSHRWNVYEQGYREVGLTIASIVGAAHPRSKCLPVLEVFGLRTDRKVELEAEKRPVS